MEHTPGLFDDAGENDPFDAILSNTLGHEGGFTVDHAGPTNQGITQSTFDRYRKSMDLEPRDVKTIREDEVYDLYRSDFYETPKINKLPPKVQGVVFDFGVNSSPDRAIKTLQRTVGAMPDGDIGPKTIEAVNSYVEKNGEDGLVNAVINKREGFLKQLIQDKPEKYKKFENGWNNRLKKLRDQYGKLTDSLDPFGSPVMADEITDEQRDYTPNLFDEESTQEATPNLFDEERGFTPGLFEEQQPGIIDKAKSSLNGLRQALGNIQVDGTTLKDLGAGRGKSDLQRASEFAGQEKLIPETMAPEQIAEVKKQKTPVFEKIGKGFGTGVAGMVEGVGGVAKWFGAEDIGGSINKYADEMKQFYDVPDKDFLTSVSAGAGSMATFMIPGLGVARGVQAMSAVPRLAAWLGASASAVMEASVEAGGAYNTMIAKGKDHKEASVSANKDFWLNLPVIVFTNKAGIFGENGGVILKGLKSATSESIQEFSQQLIGNFSTKDPLFEGALESAAVGAVVGGGTGALMSLAERKDVEKIKAKDLIKEQDKEEKQAAKLEDVSTDVGTKKTIDVNVTPEMKDAVDSGLPAIEVKPEIEAVLEKSNISEERRSAIIKLLETPEKPTDTGTQPEVVTEPETKPTTQVEAKGEEQTPPINLGEDVPRETLKEIPSVNQDQARVEGSSDNVKAEDVKPQDFKTAEDMTDEESSFVSSKIKPLSKDDIRLRRQPDGKYYASIKGEGTFATGATSEEAISKLKERRQKFDDEKKARLLEQFRAKNPVEQKPVQKQEAAADVDTISKDFAGRLNQTEAPFHKKFAQAIIDKNPEFISQLVAQAESANRNARAVFVKYTGVELPKTIGGKREAIYKWAGKEIPKPKEKAPEPPKMTREDAFKKAQAQRAENALDKPVRYQGTVMKKRGMIELLAKRGAIAKANELEDKNAMTRLMNERRDLGRFGNQNINAKRIAEINKLVDAGVKKIEYTAELPDRSDVVISKTEYDYLNSLNKTNPEVQPEAKKEPAKEAEKVETDSARIQEIKNSIAEGEMILKSGKDVTGKKMSKGALESVKRSVENSRKKIGQPKQENAVKKPASGEENVIVTKEEHKAAGDRINSKLRRLSANPMLDPELWADLLKVGTFHLERGGRTFAAWSERMVNEFGEAIRPHLDNIWKGVTNDAPVTDIPPIPTKMPKVDKVAKAASDINMKAVQEGIAEIPEDQLAMYASSSYKQDAEDFATLMTNDLEKAQRMAFGEISFPAGLLPQIGFNAVKNKAFREGDVETIARLRKSPLASGRSELAKQLGSAGYDNGMTEADPIKAANEISKVREENKEVSDKRVSDLEAQLAEAERKLEEAISKQHAKSKTSPSFGSRNVLFKKEGLEKARAELKRKLGGLRANIDPTALIEFTQIGGYYFEGGMREFSSWSAEMVKEFGSKIQPYLQPAWDDIKAKYVVFDRERILKRIIPAMQEGIDISNMTASIQALAENFVLEGVVDRNDLVDKIHAILSEDDSRITKRNVADAISGYGKFTQLSDDAIKAKLRDIKGQLQQVSKIEDLQRKIAPAKTGVERRSPSDEERRLIKQVEELKKQSGIVTSDPTKQLKSALASIKTNLSNQIKDLEKQIADGQKIVREKRTVELDKEAKDLTVRRDELKREFDAIFAKPGLTEQQRIEIATRAVTRSITTLENKIKTGDIEVKKPKTAVTSKELEELRARREALKESLQELRDIANPPRTDEQKAIDALKSRLKSEQAKIEKQIEDNDFIKKQRPPVQETPEIKALRDKLAITREKRNAAKSVADGVTDEELKAIVDMSKAVYDAKDKMNADFTWADKQDGIDFGAANVAFKRYVAKLKQDAQGSGLVNPIEGKTLTDKYQRSMQDFKVIFNFIADNTKAILGSLDNSFHGRQGIKALTNPRYVKPWFNNFIQSWGNIWTTLKGDIGKTSALNAILGKDAITAGDIITDSVIVDAYSRKNYLNGRYNKGVKLDIATGEEAFPTSLPARIPVLGRLFKASEVAYEASAMRLRLDIADILYDLAEKSGQDMDSKQLIGDINQLANEMTGRGGLGRMGSAKAINRAFFSIKNAKSNIDFLLRPFYPNQSEFTRKEAAKNLLSTVVMIAVVLAIAKAFDDDKTELDPRGDMFGKIRLGNGAVIDITGGISGFVILAARLLTGVSKNSKTGIYRPIGESFGSADGVDILVNFATNKLSPIAGAIRDYLRGRNFDNKKPTFTSTATGLITPIPSQNVIELSSKDESNAVKLGAMILDGLGFGMSYRDMSQDWEGKTSKEMMKFREVRGENVFKEANKKYNKMLNDRIDHVLNSNQYKDLDDDEKLRVISFEKDQIKDRILGMYGFKYRNEKKSPVTKIE